MTCTLSRLFFLLSLLAFCSGSVLGQDNGDSNDSDSEFNACQAVENAALFKPMSEIRTTLRSDGKRMPPDCAQEFFTAQSAGDTPRFSTLTTYNWEPTNFFHMPTYFDDVPLERYGQHRHERLQPFVSGARFVLQLPVLPYKMGVDRPHECISTLGHRPPGDCVPCIKQRIPLEADAAFLQAAATVGLVFLLP
jgi:hypothetical protein